MEALYQLSYSPVRVMNSSSRGAACEFSTDPARGGIAGSTRDRGAVLVEYTAVFGFVSIGLAIAIVKLGPTLLGAWDSTRTVILSNKP